MKTLVATADSPNYDRRNVPIWALIQIDNILKLLSYKAVVDEFTYDLQTSKSPMGKLIIRFTETTEKGCRYVIILFKFDMNNKSMPPMFYIN